MTNKVRIIVRNINYLNFNILSAFRFISLKINTTQRKLMNALTFIDLHQSSDNGAAVNFPLNHLNKRTRIIMSDLRIEQIAN